MVVLRLALEAFAHLLDNEIVGRVLACRGLGVDPFVVDHHFIASATRGDQYNLLDGMGLAHRRLECCNEAFRQTGGTWGVVSSHAEFNRDAHAMHVMLLCLAYADN